MLPIIHRIEAVVGVDRGGLDEAAARAPVDRRKAMDGLPILAGDVIGQDPMAVSAQATACWNSAGE